MLFHPIRLNKCSQQPLRNRYYYSCLIYETHEHCHVTPHFTLNNHTSAHKLNTPEPTTWSVSNAILISHYNIPHTVNTPEPTNQPTTCCQIQIYHTGTNTTTFNTPEPHQQICLKHKKTCSSEANKSSSQRAKSQ